MFYKVNFRRRFLDLTFLLLMVTGVTLIQRASACGDPGARCFPPVTCLAMNGNCTVVEVVYGGSCDSCPCPPCECVFENGHCSLPDPGPGTPFYPYCNCTACVPVNSCPPRGDCVDESSSCT